VRTKNYKKNSLNLQGIILGLISAGGLVARPAVVETMAGKLRSSYGG